MSKPYTMFGWNEMKKKEGKRLGGISFPSLEYQKFEQGEGNKVKGIRRKSYFTFCAMQILPKLEILYIEEKDINFPSLPFLSFLKSYPNTALNFVQIAMWQGKKEEGIIAFSFQIITHLGKFG